MDDISADGAVADDRDGSPQVVLDAPGCSCVPPLIPVPDRVATIQRLVLGEPEPIVALTQLLRLCRDEHATLWEHHADARCRSRVAALVADVARALPTPGTTSTVEIEARRALAAALTADTAIPPVVVAHALAELLDISYGHTFANWFRNRSPYQPAVGDPIPLDSPDLRRVTELAPTAPPWRLANRLDETRRIRLAGSWTTQFQVVFDYSLYHVLEGVITGATVIATCHPNHDLGELGLSPDYHGSTFPVEPHDPAVQAERIDRLVSEAADSGASIVLLPELSVTEDLAHRLEPWVRRPGPLQLLVAGSFHHTDSADPTRRANRALAWVRGHPAPLTHDKFSPADRPVAEDITPLGWPEVRIYVIAGGWHLVIAVCRDLLNPHAVHALAEAGANLVLAPSMSETLLAFGGPVAQLVGATQAIVAVANNPADWSRPELPDQHDPPARALFGHPGFAQQTRQVHAPDRRVGVAFFSVGSGRLRWRSTEPADAAEGVTVDLRREPAWIQALALHTTPARPQANGSLALRPAAVLVILTDGPDGPHALLTARAPELTHYSGQYVFPGGGTDAGDRDAVDTALREAGEEIGLDPASVRVLGTLPALGLPDSGFLVTPVLAWSRRPRYFHPANPAEVTTVRAVRLASYRDGRHRRESPEADIGAPPDGRVDAARVGAMTSAILDQLAAYVAAASAAAERTERGGDPSAS